MLIDESCLGGWPFAVESGLLECQGFSITFTSESIVDGVNGNARRRDGFADAFDILSDITEKRVFLQPVIDLGLDLCGCKIRS
jgi:hypothetical protein